MKRIVILGSSGSIGQTAVSILRGNPDFEVVGLSVRTDTAALLRDAAALGCRHVAVADLDAAARIAPDLPPGLVLHRGGEGLCELVRLGADIVLCAIVGMAGLRPVLAAIDAGADIALATKEVLVAAGGEVMRRRLERGVRILPVDSEHSAIFQALQSRGREAACTLLTHEGRKPASEVVRRLILTASGGPFFFRPELDFDAVTPDDALKHPKWKMGRKITVDSATMMNKGLEIIEARWLFDVPQERISVVVHPESIVHSIVEYRDLTQIAEMSEPDMTFAINYALSWPERSAHRLDRPLDLVKAGTLRFFNPDEGRFPCLALAREALGRGGAAPAALNAANEVAVQAFLDRRIRFGDIWRIAGRTLDSSGWRCGASIDDIFAADAEARARAGEFAAKLH